MAGKSPVTASNEQRGALMALAGSRDRGEADRARAVLLTLAGWTSPKIAEAFGVREDTVRLWRSDFANGGVGALKASVAPGPAPVKSEAALRVATPLLEEPVADRRNWTIPRLRAEIEAREGVRISRSQLSKALRKKFRWRRPRHALKGRQTEARWNGWACACANSRPKRATSFFLCGDARGQTSCERTLTEFFEASFVENPINSNESGYGYVGFRRAAGTRVGRRSQFGTGVTQCSSR